MGNIATLDEIDLGRKVLKRIAEDEKLFVDAVMLGCAVTRMKTPDDEAYGYDLVADAWSDVGAWFREMHARFYGRLHVAQVPGKRAAFEDHREDVRREVEEEMRAEVESARNHKALVEERAKWHPESSIESFAANLEIARIIYRKHRKLVEASVFPEPYRSAILAANEYDTETQDCLDIDDQHITDPEAAAAECLRFGAVSAAAELRRGN